MQTEIKLRPPYQLSPEDLQAINGFSVHMTSKYKGLGVTSAPDVWTLNFAERVTFLCPLAAPTQMLEPVTLPGIVSCVLSVLCGGLNLLRGVHAIESVLQVPCLSFDALFPTRPVLKEQLFSPQQNDDEDFNYVIAFFLGTAACLYQVSDCSPVRAARRRLTNGPALYSSAACQLD